MGWTPVNMMNMTRDFNTREIIIWWIDDVTGLDEKRFPFEQKDEALKFAAAKFNEVAM